MTDTKKPLTVLQRLDMLENVSENLLKTVSEVNQKNRESTAMLVEVVTAVMQAMGDGFEEKVENIVKDKRQKRAQEEADKAKAALEGLVQSGVFVAQPTVAEDSVVVGREFDPQGNLVGVGRVQVEFAQFTADVKPKLLGKEVGTVIDVDNGAKFEVLEVYHQNPNPPVVETPAVEEQK